MNDTQIQLDMIKKTHTITAEKTIDIINNLGQCIYSIYIVNPSQYSDNSNNG
jgi:hypothetical protein